MPGGTSNPVGQNGTLNGAGTGGITNAPFYGTPMQQMADPLHLFPSPTADNGAPSSLPSLGINAQMYGGHFANQRDGTGYWNTMASRMAGPRYAVSAQPTMMRPPMTMTNPGAPASPSSGGSSMPSLLKLLGGGFALNSGSLPTAMTTGVLKGIF